MRSPRARRNFVRPPVPSLVLEKRWLMRAIGCTTLNQGFTVTYVFPVDLGLPKTDALSRFCPGPRSPLLPPVLGPPACQNGGGTNSQGSPIYPNGNRGKCLDLRGTSGRGSPLKSRGSVVKKGSMRQAGKPLMSVLLGDGKRPVFASLLNQV